MNFKFSELVSQIIKGLKSYFEKTKLKLMKIFMKN